jgi:predicted negative regulator of RcsB-dependent stress response
LDESEAAYRKLLQLNPAYSGGQARLAKTLLFNGKKSEALAAVEKETEEAWKLIMLSVVYWALGRNAESDATLRELEQKFAAIAAYNIAQIHAYRGEIDAAFAWLDRAYDQRDSMRWTKFDPLLRNLHNDPRYKAVLRKMKFPE